MHHAMNGAWVLRAPMHHLKRYVYSVFRLFTHKYDTWCRHSIRKMISASRRIFWHSFHPSSKKTRLFGFRIYVSSGCNIQKYFFPTKISFEICSKQLSTMRNSCLILPMPEKLYFNELLRL